VLLKINANAVPFPASLYYLESVGFILEALLEAKNMVAGKFSLFE